MTLTQEQVLALELVVTKRQLAEAREKLAINEMKEAQRELVKSSRDEAVFVAKVAAAHGLPNFKSVRVLQGNQIAYELD